MTEAPVEAEAAVSSPTSNDLIALLDREIEAAHAEGARTGWTLQAALAATGAIVWLLLGEIQAGYPDWTAFCGVLICSSCLLDAAVYLGELLGSHDGRGEVRFLWFGRVLAKAPSIAASGVRGVLLATLAMLLLPPDSSGAKVLACLYFGVYGGGELVSALALEGLLKAGYAQPDRFNRNAVRVRVALGVVLAVLTASALVRIVPWNASSDVAKLMRVGGGAAVLIFFAVRIPDIGSEKLLVRTLSDARRRLALKQASPEDVAREIDVAVIGNRVAGALGWPIARVMRRREMARMGLRNGRVLLQREASLPELTPNTAVECRRLLSSVDGAIESGEKRLKSLRVWIRAMSSTTPAVRPEAADVLRKVEEAFADVRADRDAYAAELSARSAPGPGRSP